MLISSSPSSLSPSSLSSSSFLDNLAQNLCWRTTEPVLNGSGSQGKRREFAESVSQQAQSLFRLLRRLTRRATGVSADHNPPPPCFDVNVSPVPFIWSVLPLRRLFLFSSIPAAITASSWGVSTSIGGLLALKLETSDKLAGRCVEQSIETLLAAEIFYDKEQHVAEKHRRSYKLSPPFADASSFVQLLLCLSIREIFWVNENIGEGYDAVSSTASLVHALALALVDGCACWWCGGGDDDRNARGREDDFDMIDSFVKDPDYDPSEFEPFTAGDDGDRRGRRRGKGRQRAGESMRTRKRTRKRGRRRRRRRGRRSGRRRGRGKTRRRWRRRWRSRRQSRKNDRISLCSDDSLQHPRATGAIPQAHDRQFESNFADDDPDGERAGGSWQLELQSLQLKKDKHETGGQEGRGGRGEEGGEDGVDMENLREMEEDLGKVDFLDQGDSDSSEVRSITHSPHAPAPPAPAPLSSLIPPPPHAHCTSPSLPLLLHFSFISLCALISHKLTGCGGPAEDGKERKTAAVWAQRMHGGCQERVLEDGRLRPTQAQGNYRVRGRHPPARVSPPRPRRLLPLDWDSPPGREPS
eukprot:766924-Hanusia_phi.AAC.2